MKDRAAGLLCKRQCGIFEANTRHWFPGFFVTTESQPPARNGDFASARILIVDDEGAICHTISKALQRIGGYINTAMSGEEALKLIAEQTFDVVLTDIRMPDISGVELLARVKAQIGR